MNATPYTDRSWALFGFAPWIVYWILVGNVFFVTAVLVAFTVATAAFVVARVGGSPGRTLEIGSVATFFILTVLTFSVSQAFTERWIQPLSTAGIFVVALVSALIGRPFVREFAEVAQPEEVVESEPFARITSLLTWMLIAAFGGMTVSAAIPPIVQGDATILDTRSPLTFVCYWVAPFALLGVAALLTRMLPERMAPAAEELIRNTTFVAFAEAEIDELIYLATEHANREVGVGVEPFWHKEFRCPLR